MSAEGRASRSVVETATAADEGARVTNASDSAPRAEWQPPPELPEPAGPPELPEGPPEQPGPRPEEVPPEPARPDELPGGPPGPEAEG